MIQIFPFEKFGEPRLSAMRFIHMDGPDDAPQGRVLDLWVEVAPFPNVWDLQSRTILMSWARPPGTKRHGFFFKRLNEIGWQMAEMGDVHKGVLCVFSWLPSDSSGILKPKSWLIDKKSLHADKHDTFCCCKEPWCLDFCLFLRHMLMPFCSIVWDLYFVNTLSRLWMPKALQA